MHGKSNLRLWDLSSVRVNKWACLSLHVYPAQHNCCLEQNTMPPEKIGHDSLDNVLKELFWHFCVAADNGHFCKSSELWQMEDAQHSCEPGTSRSFQIIYQRFFAFANLQIREFWAIFEMFFHAIVGLFSGKSSIKSKRSTVLSTLSCKWMSKLD